jgi:hypothetical protein
MRRAGAAPPLAQPRLRHVEGGGEVAGVGRQQRLAAVGDGAQVDVAHAGLPRE